MGLFTVLQFDLRRVDCNCVKWKKKRELWFRPIHLPKDMSRKKHSDSNKKKKSDRQLLLSLVIAIQMLIIICLENIKTNGTMDMLLQNEINL